MPISFHCPSCNATRSAPEVLAGRKVRCPNCDALVNVAAGSPGGDDPTATVAIAPLEADGSRTVMLEAIEVTEFIEAPPIVPSGAMPAVHAEPPPVEDEVAPRITKKGRVEDTEMDMTPMVDVTFLLLIFFMVTASFTLQKSLQVPKPNLDEEASASVVEPEQDDSDRVTVQVDAFNTYHVITADWEEEAPSVQDLLRYLRQAREGDSTGKIPNSLLVEANGESTHEKVVAALDAGSDTGFEEVLLATVEGE